MSRRKRRERTPVEAEIEDLSHDGRGVARIDGKTVFIHGALPGETVRFIFRSRRKQFDQGEVTEVLRPSPHRVEPPCPHFDVCAGCSLQHLAYAEQLQAKHKVVVQALARIGNVTPERWFDPIAAPPLHYRRKARLSVRDVPGKGRVLVGFRERNGRYVADMTRCLVLREELGESLSALSALMGELSISRDIPQIEYAGGDEQAVLVIRHLAPLSPEDHECLVTFEREHAFVIALQAGPPESIVGLDGEPVDDLTYVVDDGAIRFAFAPTDFVQVNAAINERILGQAIELLRPGPDDRILDLFCGLGNLSLPLARRCHAVMGVEGEQTLVDRARANALANGIDNAQFDVADLREDHRGAVWAQETYDIVVVDPPRSGAAEVLPLLQDIAPQQILYVSCNPGTLARDLGTLVNDYGYRLTDCGAFDMFPHTAHVESMARLER